jgi:hypothetical protein
MYKGIINKTFLLDIKTEEDKDYQEFKIFVNNPEVKKYIKITRVKFSIKPTTINKKLKEYLNIIKEAAKKSEKVEEYIKKNNPSHQDSENDFSLEAEKKLVYAKIIKKRDKLWSKIESCVNSKISIDDIVPILAMFDKPTSWEQPLSCYILTNKIKPHLFKKFKVEDKNENILLTISADATARDLKKAFKYIKNIQPYLRGYSQKKKRKKKDVDEQINIAKDYKNYTKMKNKPYKEKDPATEEIISVNPKKEKKLNLVDKYNKNAIDKKSQKKEEGRQRQIYHRYKNRK